MELVNIEETIELQNKKQAELKNVLEDITGILNVEVENTTIKEHEYLQSLMNRVVELRRIINSFNASVPDIQADIRIKLAELEDRASLEG